VRMVVLVGENQPEAEKLSRRPIGAGMFRRGDENV
jgi:hypothetical protein